MPSLNPWVYVGVLVAFIAVGGGMYWKGSVDGANSVKAGLAESYSEYLTKFREDAVKAAAAATADALADFTAKAEILDKLAADFRKAKGIMDAAASNLANSLKNSACVLSPTQRQFLECVRRPSSPGCVPASPG